MNKATYIQLDKHIERIMPLECVDGIMKDGNGNYVFHLAHENHLLHTAIEGEWLVCYNDKWYCVTNEQKKNGYEPWKG